jgi:hypothetical protein
VVVIIVAIVIGVLIATLSALVIPSPARGF